MALLLESGAWNFSGHSYHELKFLQLAHPFDDHRLGLFIRKLWVLQNKKFFLTFSLISPDSDFNLPRFPESKEEKPENLPRSHQWTGIDILNLRTVCCFQISQFGDLFFAFLDRTSCGDRFWIAIRVWVHVLLVPNCKRIAQSFLHANSRVLWITWLCAGDHGLLDGTFRKSIFRHAWRSASWSTLLINCIGILITIYGALVVYLVTKPSYKRRPLPEEISLLSRTAGWKLTKSDVNYQTSAHCDKENFLE